MKRTVVTAGALLLAAAAVLPVSDRALGQATQSWTSLFDGKSLDTGRRSATPIWKVEDGAAVADQGHRLSRLETTLRATSSSGRNSGPTRTPTAASSSAAPIRRRSAGRPATRSTSSTSVPNRPTAPARSSISPRSSRCRKPPANGTPTRSRRRVRTSSSCSTASRPSMSRTARTPSGVIALQEGTGADKKEGVIKFRKVEIKPL